MHSSQALCVRTSHASSLTHCSCHTLDTNIVILVASMQNHSQGITVRPIVGTPTPNGPRSNWDFLLRRFPDMLAGPTSLTFLALKRGLDDKLCPLIQFLTFQYLLWIFAPFSLYGISRIMNMSPSRGSFSITFPLTCMMVKVKWPGLSTYMSFFSCFVRNMGVLMNRQTFCWHTHFANLHFNGCATYRLTACTHLSTFAISLKTLSIILI